MSAKRQATTDLNHENWDQEDPNEVEEADGFKMASKEVLEKRMIRTAKRRSQVQKSSVFSGFSGFNKVEKSSFDFLANLTNGSQTNNTASTLKSDTAAFNSDITKPASSSSSGIFSSSGNTTPNKSTFGQPTHSTIFGGIGTSPTFTQTVFGTSKPDVTVNDNAFKQSPGSSISNINVTLKPNLNLDKPVAQLSSPSFEVTPTSTNNNNSLTPIVPTTTVNNSNSLFSGIPTSNANKSSSPFSGIPTTSINNSNSLFSGVSTTSSNNNNILFSGVATPSANNSNSPFSKVPTTSANNSKSLFSGGFPKSTNNCNPPVSGVPISTNNSNSPFSGLPITSTNNNISFFAGAPTKNSSNNITPFSNKINNPTPFNTPVTNSSESSETNKSTSTTNVKDDKLIYYNNLMGLNKSVSDWIKKHVEETPLCILTPIFRDYEKHLKDIQDEFDKSQEQCSDKKNSDKKKNTETKNSPTAVNNLGPTSISASSYNTTSSSSIISSSSSTTTSADNICKFSFGINSSTAVSTTNSSNATIPSTGFSFGIKSPSAGSSSPFATNTSTNNGNAPFSFGIGKPFAFNSNINKNDDKTNENKDNEDEPPKVEYTPIAEENSVYDKKCKVFVKKDANYIDKGVGTLYVKKIEESSKYQLLIRANTSLGNVLVNMILGSSVPIQRMGKNNVMMICIPTPDAKPPPTSILIRVKTSEDADELLDSLNKFKA